MVEMKDWYVVWIIKTDLESSKTNIGVGMEIAAMIQKSSVNETSIPDGCGKWILNIIFSRDSNHPRMIKLKGENIVRMLFRGSMKRGIYN